MPKKFKSKEEKERDEQELKDQRAVDYALNTSWIEEQEDMNLGGKRLPRNGDNAVYTNFGVGKNPDGTYCAIPSGLPIAFSDPLFQKKFMSCPHHKAAFPKWKWNSNHKQDLSNPLATEEQVQSCMDNIRATLAENKAKNFSRKQTRIYL